MKVSHKEQGLALLMLVFLLALVAIGYGVNALDSSGLENERNRKTGLALSEAKAALLGYVWSQDVDTPSFLPNPDLALSPIIAEGNESGSLGSIDITLIGKLPWKALKTAPLKDGWGECLWYVVSGRYKKSPSTTSAIPPHLFNLDTQGQINVIDAGGNPIASNLAALIIAPGAALKGQIRSQTSPSHKNCGGNYDAINYLDTYDVGNALAGEVNYFAGSDKNREAPNVNNKIFVLAKNENYNDQLIFITTDEVFKNTKSQIDNVLSNTDFHTYLKNNGVSGNKGTGNVACGDLDSYETFCTNWLEMFLFTKLPTPAPVTIDGVTTSNCDYVLIFGGKKTGTQSRDDTAKNDPLNYLEGENATAFATPEANSNNFIGNSAFDPENPDRDILRCI